MGKITDEKVELVLSVFREKVREYDRDFRRSDKPSGFWKEKYGTNLHSTGLGEAWAMRTALTAADALTAGEREPVATVAEVFVDGKRLYNTTYPADALDKLPKGAALYTSPPASELEALRNELQAAKGERDLMAREWCDFCEAMGVTVDTQEAVAAVLQSNSEDDKARLAEALKALEPFADDTAMCAVNSDYAAARRVRDGGQAE